MSKTLNALRNLAAAALLISCAAPASAASVTIGNGDEGNCYPFSCGASDGLTQYQEQYDKAAFTGPITFNTVRFGQNLPYGPDNGVPYGPTIDSASYDVSFYTSNVGFNGLSSTLSSNLGTFLGNLGTFTLGGAVSNVLSLTGNTITYDPSWGEHLLMNVVIHDVTATQGPPNTYQNFFYSDSSNEFISRAWSGSQGSVGNAGSALQTTFDMVAATPEPGTWAMMVLGFGIAGLALRRRRLASGPAHLAVSNG